VGIIGIGLPVALVLGDIILHGSGFQSSISDYYHTAMRDIFVGSLCAIAMFLMSYKGYEAIDNIAGNIASLFALGVALFPTTPPFFPTDHEKVIGILHILSAAGFFCTLAFFSLVLFRKTDSPFPLKTRKKIRNGVYTACGYTMLVCIVVIGLITFIPPDAAIRRLAPILWFESIAVVAFGISWLTKGKGMLKDLGE